MTSVHFSDSVALSGARVTRDGYLVADARIARTGIQEYRGAEVGRPEMATARIYRPEAEVFSSDALASFAHRPVTNDHPPEAVGARNWKDYAVGMTADQVARDGGYVRVPFTLMDATAIDAVNAGKRELSCGYECTLDWTPGQTADGAPYDAVQRQIRGNHLALVDKARAGPECRIGDQSATASPKGSEMSTVKVTVDGFTFDASEQAAQAISKLTTKVADTEKTLADAQAASAKMANTIEAKDGELAALKKTHGDEIAARDAKIADAEKNLDARIEERQAVVADAQKVAGKAIEGKGKTVNDIRREAVGVALGDAAVKERSDEYIRASFDTLAATKAHSDPLGAAVRANVGDRNTPVTDGYSQHVAHLTNAWKGETKGAV